MLLHPVENAPLELPKGLVSRFLYHPKTEKKKKSKEHKQAAFKIKKKNLSSCVIPKRKGIARNSIMA